MSADVLFPVFVNLQAIAAGTAEQRHVTIPMAGTWEVLSDQCYFAPSTTSAANGTNYATVSVKKLAGGTTLGSITTASVALTIGTPRAIALTDAPLSNFVAGQTDEIEIDVAHAGTGAIVDGTVALVFRKVRA